MINIDKKTAEELVSEFLSKNSHNTLDGEQYSAAIQVKNAEKITNAANYIGESIERLKVVIAESSDNIERSTKSIEKAVNKFEKTVKVIGDGSDSLSKKIFWLNVILTIATVIAAIATIGSFINKSSDSSYQSSSLNWSDIIYLS